MTSLVLIAWLLAQPPAGARDLGLLEETVARQRLTPEEAAAARPCLDSLRRHLAPGAFATLSPDQVVQLLEGHVRACAGEARGQPGPGPPQEAVLAAAEQGLRRLDQAIGAQDLGAEELADAAACLNAMRPRIAAGLFLGLAPDQVQEQVEGFVRPCVAQTRRALADLRARREALEAHQAIVRAEREAEEAVQDYLRSHPEVRVGYHGWQRCLALVELETATAARRRALQRTPRGGLPLATQEELGAAIEAARARKDAAETALAALEARPPPCGSKPVRRFEACLVQEPPSVPCAAAQWLQQHGAEPEAR